MVVYNDKHYDQYFIREFKENIDDIELVWHREYNDRFIEVLEGNNWRIQFDNDIPKRIYEGDTLYIPKMVFHRLHKGNDQLILKIREI